MVGLSSVKHNLWLNVSGLQVIPWLCLRSFSYTYFMLIWFHPHRLTKCIGALKVERQSDGKGFCTARSELSRVASYWWFVRYLSRLSDKRWKQNHEAFRRVEDFASHPPAADGRDDFATFRPKQGANIEGYVLSNVELTPNQCTYSNLSTFKSLKLTWL